MIDIARLARILSRRTVAPDRETLVTRSAHLGQAMRSITTYYPELWNGVDRDCTPPAWATAGPTCRTSPTASAAAATRRASASRSASKTWST